jgi:hypothetical protein
VSLLFDDLVCREADIIFFKAARPLVISAICNLATCTLLTETVFGTVTFAGTPTFLLASSRAGQAHPCPAVPTMSSHNYNRDKGLPQDPKIIVGSQKDYSSITEGAAALGGAARRRRVGRMAA